MAHKMDDLADEFPLATVFKLKRSRREIKSSQASLEDEPSLTLSDIDAQVLSTHHIGIGDGQIIDESGNIAELLEPMSISENSQLVSPMFDNPASSPSASEDSELVSPLFRNPELVSSYYCQECPQLIASYFRQEGPELVSPIFEGGSELVSPIFQEGSELVSPIFQENGEMISPIFAKCPDPEVVEDEEYTNVRHPWGIVDYHLYLSGIETGRNNTLRSNSMMVFDGDECRPFFLEDLYDDPAGNPCVFGKPKILFCILPIANEGAVFKGRQYILGFDTIERTLFARHFHWSPKSMGDVRADWEEGVTVYRLTIPSLATILRRSFSESDGRLNMGLLSCSPLCETFEGVCDDPGMEIVLAVEFCQWVVDCAEGIFATDEIDVAKLRYELTYYMDQCRLVLQRASYRAWFAVRDGLSMEAYSHKHSYNQYINDLYTYGKSTDDGSLRNREWQPPNVDTCNEIRDNHRNKSREETEKKLEDLFTLPNTDTPPESPGKIFARMLSKTDKSQAAALLYPLGAPRTPSPPLQYRPVPQRPLSPCSPGIVTPVRENFEDFEATEYHKVPLSLLLIRTMDLIQAHPELDNIQNRGRFGSLLTNIGVCVRREPTNEYAMDPEERDMGFDFARDNWTLELSALMDPNTPTPQARRLLPSPVLD